MSMEKKLESVIRALFGQAAPPELNYLALLQAVRHNAEQVYVYRINACHDIGRDYKSTPLFRQPATQLYSSLAPFYESELGTVRINELWLLQDLTPVAVANMQVVIGNGVIYSEYRTVKTKNFPEIPEVLSLDTVHFGKNLLDMSQDYIRGLIPTYEE